MREAALLRLLHEKAQSEIKFRLDVANECAAGGLIRRIEHTNRYALRPDGIKVAVFYTRLHNRLLRPLLAADQPQAPPELRAALHAIDQHISGYITHARLASAA